MDAPRSTDSAGLELIRKSLAELSQGVWHPDVAEIETALEEVRSPTVKARLANLLTHHHFSSNDMEAALRACTIWLEHGPDEPAARDSRISILMRLRRWDELIAGAEARLADEPDNFRLRSSLANAYARKGAELKARTHGDACLALQDRLFAGTAPTIDSGVPTFDPAAKARNAIAFSLYGANAKYIDGAVRNARAAHHLYPEWTCRFYVDDSVPEAVRARLRHEGAQVLRVEGLPAARYGTFWRFLVADDTAVDRYLVRDCDACLSLRERAAVEEWIASGRHFHLMRDGFTHTDIVLAGMWGGVRGALPPIGAAMLSYCATAPFSRTADQSFLRERMWPWIRQSVLAHDSCFGFGGAQAFPARAEVPGPRVGEAVSSPPVD